MKNKSSTKIPSMMLSEKLVTDSVATFKLFVLEFIVCMLAVNFAWILLMELDSSLAAL